LKNLSLTLGTDKLKTDAQAGRLDHLAAEADHDFEAGRCTLL
jgi:hypothetical protein